MTRPRLSDMKPTEKALLKLVEQNIQTTTEGTAAPMKKRSLSITIDPALFDKLDEESRRRRRNGVKYTWTLSAVTEEALEKFLQ